MRAVVGDRLVMKGCDGHEPHRDGEILGVHGYDGAPPFVVRWSDNGHIGLVFPGSDALVDHCQGKVRPAGLNQAQPK